MKNFLFIVVMALLLMGCDEKKPEGYADIGPARRGMQLSIYDATITADTIGFIDEENDSTTVDSLRKKAEEIDSMLVSCLIIEDCAKDAIISIYDIK